MYRLLVLTLFLAACSSGQKSAAPRSSGAQGQGMSDSEMAGEEVTSEEPSVEEAVVVHTPLKGEAAYEAFSKAIRSRNEAAVTQEASKLLSTNPNDLKTLNGLAMFYYTSGKPQLAKIPLARALKAHPDSATLANNLGLIHLSEDRTREAVAEFRRALTLDQGHAEASYHLGAIFVKYKNYVNALPLLQRAYSAFGKKELVGPHYAEALRLAGKLKESEDVYEEIKAENSNSPAVLLNYAVLLVDQLKSKRQGQKIINKLRFLSQDADILKKVDDLSDRAEAIK